MTGPGGGDGGTVGGSSGGVGGTGCAAEGGVVVVGPLSKSYTQVVNHFRPILNLVPALTPDAR